MRPIHFSKPNASTSRVVQFSSMVHFIVTGAVFFFNAAPPRYKICILINHTRISLKLLYYTSIKHSRLPKAFDISKYAFWSIDHLIECYLRCKSANSFLFHSKMFVFIGFEGFVGLQNHRESFLIC